MAGATAVGLSTDRQGDDRRGGEVPAALSDAGETKADASWRRAGAVPAFMRFGGVRVQDAEGRTLLELPADTGRIGEPGLDGGGDWHLHFVAPRVSALLHHVFVRGQRRVRIELGGALYDRSIDSAWDSGRRVWSLRFK